MPTLSVERDVLFNHLGGKTYTDTEFDELCFEFGIELDEITCELEEAMKSNTVKLTEKEKASLSTAVVYKIDVPANRYDMLCVEGLSRALKIFLKELDSPTFSKVQPATTPTEEHVMVVNKTNVDTIRPFVVCAVLRDITFTQERYKSFIDLQDQLHRNLCRNRTLVAIGTHDMDSIKGPYKYDARSPTDIDFVPLVPNDKGSFKSNALLELYETDVTCKHLKPYVGIIKDSPKYPVVLDSEETVLSLPPIINGDHSKITLDTKNVFIECTATDLTKANIVLDTVVTMFSEYCAKPFTVEPVTVKYEDSSGKVVNEYVTPELSTRKERASVEFCNSIVGIDISPQEMKELCDKVQLGPASLLDGDTVLEVTVPPTRSDILHPVDIAEDIAVSYGYNNIIKTVPQTCTVGNEQELNKVGDLLRDEISRAGYIEILTHGLCSRKDNFTSLRRPITSAVSLSNPANVEYEVVRTTLLPGLLKTLQHNKAMSFTSGFKIFEISDVVIPDSNHVITETIVGAKNVRKVCAVYAGPKSGFEIIHGLVDRIMTLLEVKPEDEYISNSIKGDEEKLRVVRDGWFYTISELLQNSNGGDENANTYFPGRAASILVTNPSTKERVQVGTFGILHPEVLNNFDIQYPASCVEIDLELLI